MAIIAPFDLTQSFFRNSLIELFAKARTNYTPRKLKLSSLCNFKEDMNYGAIKKTDVADGSGVRVSLFVSGCRNHCPGCFQPETWNFDFGKQFTQETENEILEALKPSFISGFSLLGGEPFEPENQEVLAPFLEKIKQTYPTKDIWCWTGYILEKDLQEGGRKHTPFTDRMLACIDVLVDGPFIQEQRNLMLEFRGSENQRIIKLHS